MPPNDAIFTLFGGLPRHAPGSEASTQRAAEISRPYLPAKPLTLDLGCGVGRSAQVLESTLEARVVGLDLYRPFLENANRIGIPVVEADMAAPPFAGRQFDLVWSEGALYHLGIERGLALAASLLRQNGVLGFTELCRLVAKPPAEAERFWTRVYPAVSDVMALRSVAEQVGYEVLETFRLPLVDWEQEYYGPLRRRIPELTPVAQEWEELRTMLTELEREIRILDRHGDSYGYIFCVARRL